MHAAHTDRGHLRARQKHRCTTAVPTLSFISLINSSRGLQTDSLPLLRCVSEMLDFMSGSVEVASKAPRKSALGVLFASIQ
ncbi:uncharacterized protein [Miscanthus floridulus]|uniref:uncharacterized protein n=1 Tax=Miscanthus floridulus TaxID=154761 RepID=UPI003457FEE8